MKYLLDAVAFTSLTSLTSFLTFGAFVKNELKLDRILYWSYEYEKLVKIKKNSIQNLQNRFLRHFAANDHNFTYLICPKIK